jgi:hypothetical protein
MKVRVLGILYDTRTTRYLVLTQIEVQSGMMAAPAKDRGPSACLFTNRESSSLKTEIKKV